MINLLPQEEKRQIQAGRSNVLLLRYNILLLMVVAFLGLAIGVTYYILSTSQVNAEVLIAKNIEKEKTYSTLKAQADNFRSQLSEAKLILDGDLSYSDTVLTIAALVPKGVVLTNITLNRESFSQPITLVAHVKGEQEALNFRENFQNSPLFSNADFGVLTKSETSGYPYTIELRVTMKSKAIR